LEYLFNGQDYIDVDTENDIYVGQTFASEYSVFLFKEQHGNNIAFPTVTWKGRSNIAPSSSIVYLQVYNRTSATWETLNSDNATAADTKFTLTGTITGTLSDYYDNNRWVSYRIYQLSV
jgi:hypothetical protein